MSTPDSPNDRGRKDRILLQEGMPAAASKKKWTGQRRRKLAVRILRKEKKERRGVPISFVSEAGRKAGDTASAGTYHKVFLKLRQDGLVESETITDRRTGKKIRHYELTPRGWSTDRFLDLEEIKDWYPESENVPAERVIREDRMEPEAVKHFSPAATGRNTTDQEKERTNPDETGQIVAVAEDGEVTLRKGRKSVFVPAEVIQATHRHVSEAMKEEPALELFCETIMDAGERMHNEAARWLDKRDHRAEKSSEDGLYGPEGQEADRGFQFWSYYTKTRLGLPEKCARFPGSLEDAVRELARERKRQREGRYCDRDELHEVLQKRIPPGARLVEEYTEKSEKRDIIAGVVISEWQAGNVIRTDGEDIERPSTQPLATVDITLALAEEEKESGSSKVYWADTLDPDIPGDDHRYRGAKSLKSALGHMGMSDPEFLRDSVLRSYARRTALCSGLLGSNADFPGPYCDLLFVDQDLMSYWDWPEPSRGRSVVDVVQKIAKTCREQGRTLVVQPGPKPGPLYGPVVAYYAKNLAAKRGVPEPAHSDFSYETYGELWEWASKEAPDLEGVMMERLLDPAEKVPGSKAHTAPILAPMECPKCTECHAVLRPEAEGQGQTKDFKTRREHYEQFDTQEELQVHVEWEYRDSPRDAREAVEHWQSWQSRQPGRFEKQLYHFRRLAEGKSNLKPTSPRSPLWKAYCNVASRTETSNGAYAGAVELLIPDPGNHSTPLDEVNSHLDRMMAYLVAHSDQSSTKFGAAGLTPLHEMAQGVFPEWHAVAISRAEEQWADEIQKRFLITDEFLNIFWRPEDMNSSCEVKSVRFSELSQLDIYMLRSQPGFSVP